MKHFFKLLITVLSVISVFSCSNSADIAVESVTLSQNSLSLIIGEQKTLSATVLPQTATDKSMTWSSSNSSVASVADGTVSAIAAGSATITVTTKSGAKTASCNVTVVDNKIAVTSITLNKYELTLAPGTTETLVASVSPSDATDKTVVWSSSNESVATVSEGVVTAISAGEAVITAKTKDGGFSATCSLVVANIPSIQYFTTPEKIEINKNVSFYNTSVAYFAWMPQDGEVAEYVFSISDTDTFATSASIETTGEELDFFAKPLNQIFAALGVEPGKAKTLYFRIADKAGVLMPATVSIEVMTAFGSFMDPRDGEIYPTIEVGDFTWMCENLRAMKYSDGSSFPEADANNPQLWAGQYEAGVYGLQAGTYYAFSIAVNDFYDGHWENQPAAYDASIQVQGVCPEGWHVTARNDWNYMIEEAMSLTGETFRSDFWTAAWKDGTAEAFNKLVCSEDVVWMTTTGTDQLGLHFVPVGYYNLTSALPTPDTAPSAYDWQAHSTCATMTDFWTALTFAFTPNNTGAASYFSNTDCINPTYGYAMPVRCVKNY